MTPPTSDVKILIIKQGDIYWVNAEPYSGREQGGHDAPHGNVRRPVIVVSNDAYNATNMAIVYPITSRISGPKFVLPVQIDKPSGIILTRILAYDMEARAAEYSGVKVSKADIEFLVDNARHMF